MAPSSNALVLALLLSPAAAYLKTRDAYEAQFYEHMEKYDLEFESGEEFVKRLEIFAENDDRITTHNNGNSTYTLGHNAYSHLTWEEFQTMFNLGRDMPISKKGTKVHTAKDHAILDSVDWVTEGKVTPVKNQGSCGSCWSFSATGGMEGAYAIANNKDISTWSGFSEQQLVSCDTTDDGCDGGLMDNAFEWVEGNGGICSEDDYPYASSSGVAPSCSASCSSVDGSAPASYTDVEATTSALESAVSQQPVSVAIQANQIPFQSYSGGVLTGRCGTNLDHGVLAVGYGTWTDGTDYWKVKNSWGDSWGDAGYILIEKGGTTDECGILDMASYPTY
jgi:C1A family cysteine protease